MIKSVTMYSDVCDRCGKTVERMARFGYMKERIEGFEILCSECYKKKKELG